MKPIVQKTALLAVAVLTVGELSLIAFPALRNQLWFALDSAWPHREARGLPGIIGRLLRPRVPVWVQVEPHIVMRLDPLDDVDHLIVDNGAWEPDTWHGLSEHVLPGGVFVDVGAHIGYYSLKAAARVGASGRVLAIEPNPQTVARLRANVRESRASVVTIEQVACSDSEGTVDFFAAGRIDTGNSSMSEANAASMEPLAGRYRVPARRLDSIVRESGVPRVDVIKIDVEGAELLVLKGATETLRRFHPVVVVEMNDRTLRNMGASAAGVIEFLRQQNYAPRHTYGEFKNTEFAFKAGLSGPAK